jgi:hypothetical protein
MGHSTGFLSGFQLFSITYDGPLLPNIVWIFGDQHRAHALGTRGRSQCPHPASGHDGGNRLPFHQRGIGKSPPETLPDSAFLQHLERKRFDCLNRTWRGIRTRDGWKYIVLEHQPFAMFNLNEDLYEWNNLAFKKEGDAKREELQQQLADWLECTGDTFPLPEL